MARKKTPLALLPGLILDAALWRHQLEHLGDIAEMRVADFTTQDSIPEMARSVLEMMPEETFALAGLSMGGYVALEVLRQAPERIERLALLDTRAAPDDPEEIARRRALVRMSKVGEFKGVTERLLPLFIHEDRLTDRPLVAAIQAMSKRVGREAFGRQQQAILTRLDARPLLGRIE
ncbi:MAG: alpha/beta fold hydrolase, partial [Rhodovibrionaceae bacterium]